MDGMDKNGLYGRKWISPQGLDIMDVDRKHFATIDSTNTWAKHNAPLLDHAKVTLVTADEQTAGRGRFKRKWVSPSGLNIYATFCIFIEKHRPDIGNLPQILALAASRVLKELGFNPLLKWPNDVLLSGKKVAGILCETTPLSDNLCVILGIGLNVNMTQEQLEQIDRPAISLLVADGKQRNVEEITLRLQNQFLDFLELYLSEGFIPFLEGYKRNIVHCPGDEIHFHDNRTIWTGIFHSITSDGALTLQMKSGEFKTFHAGEIV